MFSSKSVIVTELKSSALTKTDNSNPYFQNSIVLARFVLFLSGIPKNTECNFAFGVFFVSVIFIINLDFMLVLQSFFL